MNETKPHVSPTRNGRRLKALWYDDDVVQEIERIAKSEYRSFSTIARRMLREGVERAKGEGAK